MKRYIVKKSIILGASNRHFVIGQELPVEIDSETIRQLLDSDSIFLTEETESNELEVEEEVVKTQRRKKGMKNG